MTGSGYALLFLTALVKLLYFVRKALDPCHHNGSVRSDASSHIIQSCGSPKRHQRDSISQENIALTGSVARGLHTRLIDGGHVCYITNVAWICDFRGKTIHDGPTDVLLCAVLVIGVIIRYNGEWTRTACAVSAGNCQGIRNGIDCLRIFRCSQRELLGDTITTSPAVHNSAAAVRIRGRCVHY
jgi:hypothetical protein